MTSYDALLLFRDQLERRVTADGCAVKVVLSPTSVKEKGIVIMLAVQKTYPEGKAPAYGATRAVRVRVSVQGTAESMTGLKMALSTIESLDDYISPENVIRLEDSNGDYIPNTRIVTRISEDDSFLDSPDSTEVQDVEDVRTCLLTIPNGGQNGV